MAKESPLPVVELAGATPRETTKTENPNPHRVELRRRVISGVSSTLAGRVATLGGELSEDQARLIARVAVLVADAVCDLEAG